MDLRGLEDEIVLAEVDTSSSRPFWSISLPVFRLGDGDLDDVIHDLRAKLANDSDTVFDLSRVALEICGTGGASMGVLLARSGGTVCSGEPLTLCIHDFGRATNDFLLPPTRSKLGRSSLSRRVSAFVTPPDLLSAAEDTGITSAEIPLFRSFSVLNEGFPSTGRQLKLADRGSSSTRLVVGRL